MSENDAQDQNVQDTPQPSTDPQGGVDQTPQGSADPNNSNQASNPAPRGLKGSGLKYTENDGVPSWAVGKTADEVLHMTQTLYDKLQRGEPSTPEPTPTPQMNTPSTPSAGINIDPNLMYSDPAAYTQQVIAAAKAEAAKDFETRANAVTLPIASMAREQAQTFKPEIWSKYGPEIDALMSDVNPQARLNVEVWKRAVNMVASEHIDDIARARAEELIRKGDVGTLPSNGSAPLGTAGSGGGSPIRDLFAKNDPAIQSHKEAGLTANDVIAYYSKMGKDEAKAAETLKNAAARRVQVGA